MADLTTTAAEHLSQGVEGSEDFVAQVAQWSDTIDTASLTGLLPVAVAMLILHEMYFSTTDNRAPRIWWMLLRIVGFGACLAGYDRVVGMLTGLVGGGNWPEPGDLIAPLDYALQAQLRQLDAVDMGNFGELGLEFFIWAMLFAIDCMLALLAFIIVTVMMKGQALALIIFIAAGKTCLILSIMPGVGIAKSWAKVVATVAAWSFMAQIVFSAVGVANPALANWAGSTSVTAHMQIWLAYGMLAVFTASIPKLVGSLVSGGMSAAPGLGMAIGGAIMGAKLLSPGSPNVRGRIQSGNEAAGRAVGSAAGTAVRAGGKVARTGGVAAGKAAATGGRAAGAAAAKVADKAVGAPVRSAALSVAMRSGSVGSGGGVPASPITSPVPRMAEAPGAVARGGKKQGDWDVAVSKKSPEQWHDEGWRSASGPIARPKAQPGHSQHKVTSGWDANGKDQYARWVQVPNKMHGPAAPASRPASSGAPGMAGAKSLSAQALASAPQAGRVGHNAPSSKTVGGIANESAASVRARPVEPPPSRGDISAAIENANHADEEASGGGAVYANSAPASAPSVSRRRGGKQER